MQGRKNKTPGELRRERLSRARLYLLFTPSLCRGNPMEVLESALRAEVDVVQVRAKELSSKDLLDLCLAVKARIRGRSLCIVNDRVDVAMLCSADGVHLGQEDLPIEKAREIGGPDLLIGASTHDLAQLKAAEKKGVDYLGLGPVFPTATKGYSQGLNRSLLQQALRQAKCPVFVIGGIEPANLKQIPFAKRIAFSASVLSSSNPAAIIKKYRDHFGV